MKLGPFDPTHKHGARNCALLAAFIFILWIAITALHITAIEIQLKRDEQTRQQFKCKDCTEYHYPNDYWWWSGQ